LLCQDKVVGRGVRLWQTVTIRQHAHHAAETEQQSKPSVEAHCEVDSRISSASQLLSNLSIVARVEGVDSSSLGVVEGRHNACPQVQPGIYFHMKDLLVGVSAAA